MSLEEVNETVREELFWLGWNFKEKSLVKF
jgi:hypothetical protein